ncbi:MAG: alkaline phosphatase family protein [Betaproteobacteria bacterium]|nr:alkaline phosphatase family protein [Betaproteobacteria bacterium]MDE2047691.1 alkaline phosphatase family protein [Betaproteobacteria bacterium]
MSHRLAIVLVDGLRADVAKDCLGYLSALVLAGRASASEFACEMPSLSRPLYATLLTGQPPLEHGVLSNASRHACSDTWLHRAHALELSSVFVAYHWFFELLAGSPFHAEQHRHAGIHALGVEAASWYYADEYPDSHVFADAHALQAAHSPDLLFVHPMGMDHAGHRFGGQSVEYRYQARLLDGILATYLPLWQRAGYDIILTSDHGMGADRMHGGVAIDERQVPYFWLPAQTTSSLATPPLPATQLGVRAFVEHLLEGLASRAPAARGTSDA